MNDTAAVVCKRVSRAKNLPEISRIFELFLFPHFDFLGTSENEESKVEVYGENNKILAHGLPMAVVYGEGEDAGRYELREAADLIPSHDVTTGFSKIESYPEGVQERPYHSDQGEQDKVRRNALRLDPRFLVTDNPDAINGPPIITREGVVLGGNSRTMSIIQAYAEIPNSSTRYLEALQKRAAVFGFTPKTVVQFTAPVLVRVVDANMSTEDMARRARIYNQSLTQGLQTKAEGVSKGRMVSSESMGVLSAALENFDSIREYLDSPRSKNLVESLLADGVIEQTQVSKLTKKDTLLLNEDGKRMVEHVLRGVAIDDYDLLDQLAPVMAAKLDRILTPLAKIKAKGGQWDISGKLKIALRQHAKFINSGIETPGAFWREWSLFDSENEIKADPQVRALFFLMTKGKPKEIEAAWKLYASTAGQSSTGQIALPGVPIPTPDSTFKKAFRDALVLESTSQENWPSFALYPFEDAILIAAGYRVNPDAVFEACFNVDEGILEAAQLRTPITTAENIQRGTEAMKRVLARHVDEPRAMYRENLGWVSFPWGKSGTPPPTFKTDKAMLDWWKSLPDRFSLFSGGYGVAHIIAKRDWEGRWIKEFLGQKGEDFALRAVEIIARGRPKKMGGRVELALAGGVVYLTSDIRRDITVKKEKEPIELWLLSGFEIQKQGYRLILESAGGVVGEKRCCTTHIDPTCESGTNAGASQKKDMQGATGILSDPTHSLPTGYRQGVGAADSWDENIAHPLTDGKGEGWEEDAGCVFESAQIRTPITTAENIQRGTEAMKRVIATHTDENRVMYREKVGWISFPWGRPGTKPPEHKTDAEKLAWWEKLSDKMILFSGGYGVSHIIAKRDWEGKWIKPLLGQRGEELALTLISTLARGKKKTMGSRIVLEFPPHNIRVILDRQKPGRDGPGAVSPDETWLVSGMERVHGENYALILESVDSNGGVDDPLCRPTQDIHDSMLWGQSEMLTDGQTAPTHSTLTPYPHGEGATDSIARNIQHPLTDGKGEGWEEDAGCVFESAQLRTPITTAENIQRGTEAMKHVIVTKGKDYHAMYRKTLGWIAFSWGTPGTPPPQFKNRKEAASWWANLPGDDEQKGEKVFPKGRGISHIIAKRDWEAQWMGHFAGQKGKNVAFQLVEVIAKGTIEPERHKRAIVYGKFRVSLVPDSRWIESKKLREQGKKKEEYWLLTGLEMLPDDQKYEVLESADGTGGGTHPSCPTHFQPTVTRQEVGAADSWDENIAHPLTDGKGEGWKEDAGCVFESAQIRTPITTAENIQRGTEAMKRVIATHTDENCVMYREKVGWISFRWGLPGTPPRSDKDDESMLKWWQSLSDREKNELFGDGSGISHIIAKRNWEGKYIKEFLGQRGEDIALKLVEVIARGKYFREGNKTLLQLPGFMAILRLDMKKSNTKSKEYEDKEHWVVSGYKLKRDGYKLIFESADALVGVKPLCPTYTGPTYKAGTSAGASNEDEQATRVILSKSTHSKPTVYRQGVGAADSWDKNIAHLQSDYKREPAENFMKNTVFEYTAEDIEQEIRATSNYDQIVALFHRIFSLPADESNPSEKEAYKNESSDYGLKVRGKKVREKLNAQCREILERTKSPEDLTPEDRTILLQYSGRGGLTENSQYEYYTPPHVAEGVWDALKANGFENGNVLDPCVGAGIFSGTKPEGVVVTGNDLDPVGSGVAALLNPSDHITTQPFERVAMNTPDDTFDSCIGNVPFGNARGVSLHEDPAYKNEKRIERYFLQRLIDKLKPGGLACLVVPVNIIGAKGKRWEEWRTILSKKAEFLGAHKLPSKTFGAQGTDTVVDVIVLRKHSTALANKVEELGIDALREAHVVWSEFVEGRYFMGEGKKFIMGRYIPKVDGDRWSRDTVDGDIDDATLKQKLAQKFHSRIDWESLTLAEPVIRAYSEGDRKSISGTMYEFISGRVLSRCTLGTLSVVNRIQVKLFPLSQRAKWKSLWLRN